MKIIAVILAMALVISAKSASRELLSMEEDLDRASEAAEDEMKDFLTSMWGKICVVDGNCVKYVAYCQKVKGGFGIIGQCRPNLGVWFVLAGVFFIILICSPPFVRYLS